MSPRSRQASRPPRLRTLRTKLRRDLLRQWPQLAAITLTILLGTALFSASYDAYRNLVASYDKTFADQRFADLWITGGDTGAIAAAARDVAGVAAVVTRIQVDVPLRVGSDKLQGRIVSLPLGRQPAVGGVSLLSGDYPDHVSDGVLVERHLADHFRLGPAAAVSVHTAMGWRDLPVAGVVSAAEYLWPAASRQEPFSLPGQFGVLYVPEPLAVEVAGTGPNQVLIRLDADAPAQTEFELRQLAATRGATDVVTRDRQPSHSILKLDIEGFRELAYLFPLLFLGAAGLATYILLARRVQSEQALIGTMLASGVPRQRVLRHYLGYGLITGTVGGLLGAAGGATAARVLTRVYLDVLGLPGASAVIPALRPDSAAAAVLLGAGAGLLMAYGPARRAARIDPAEAMRGVVAVSRGRLSLLERLVPPVRRLPARWLYVLRGIGRNRRRSAFTMLGTALALLVILSSWIMVDSMNAAIASQFTVVAKQDVQVDFAPIGSAPEGGAPAAAALDAIRRVPGVAAVEPMSQLPVTLTYGDRSYATALIALPRTTQMHGFRLPGGQTSRLPEEGIYVGRAIREQIGADAGDVLTLNVVGAPPVKLRIAGLVTEPMGTYAYISAAQLAVHFPGATVTSALLRLSPDADREAVRRAVSDLPVVASYRDSQALRRLWHSFAGLFYAFIGSMLVLGALMAFAIIFTTMSANILERQREMATLRVGGVPQRTIARILTAENLLLTVLGVLPGLGLGVAGAAALLASYTNDQIRFDPAVRPVTLAVSAAAIVLVAAVSQAPGLRAIARLDVAETVRERAG